MLKSFSQKTTAIATASPPQLIYYIDEKPQTERIWQEMFHATKNVTCQKYLEENNNLI
jgi:hypothetical protein